MKDNKKTGGAGRERIEDENKIRNGTLATIATAVVAGLAYLGKVLVDNSNQTEWDKIKKKFRR